MFYDGWYKTLRKPTSCNSSAIPSYSYSQESRENRSLEQNSTKEVNCALEGLFCTYDINEIKLGSHMKGTEADEFADLGGEDLPDDTGETDNIGDDTAEDSGFDDMGGDDDAFSDLGGDDDGGFGDFGDDTGSYSDENGDEKKPKNKKISRKEALNETYDQSTQIRNVLEFPKKFEELRNVVASNTEIALSQTHNNQEVEKTIRRVGEKYRDLLKSLDMYIANMSSKLYEDLWGDYIEFHTIAKSLKLSYDALIDM
nr:MAG TPA: hypothetical protein [Caudoviricetes sp.]